MWRQREDVVFTQQFLLCQETLAINSRLWTSRGNGDDDDDDDVDDDDYDE